MLIINLNATIIYNSYKNFLINKRVIFVRVFKDNFKNLDKLLRMYILLKSIYI
jgi:hypothetical protein